MTGPVGVRPDLRRTATQERAPRHVADHPRRSESGFVTAWMLLVPLLLLVTAGLTLDLWSAMATRTRIAAVADDAALHGATGLRTDALREGRIDVDPELATLRALAAVDGHPDRGLVTSRGAEVDGTWVRVTVAGVHRPVLLGVLGMDAIDVRVTGAADGRVGRDPPPAVTPGE